MKNEKVFRFALIGCGVISKKHILAIGQVRGALLVGAFDISDAARDQFRLSYPDIPVFNSVSEMVSQTQPDVFCILTPSGSHAEAVTSLAQYGCHFVIEKPLALRLEDADDIIQVCEANHLRSFVVKQNRFNPPLMKLHEAISLGRFGKMALGTVRMRWTRTQDYYDQKDWRGTWKHDGGVLTNQASHLIDALLWVMGDVESVYAETATRLVDIETEDTAVATLRFSSGALGVIEATTATRPKDLEGSISILGEHGSVEIGGFFMNELKTWQFDHTHDMDDTIWDQSASVPGEFAWNHSEYYQNVVDALSDGGSGLVDGIEGRKSIELLNALYESSEMGKRVSLRFAPTRSKLGV